jgi:hypothetical protein
MSESDAARLGSETGQTEMLWMRFRHRVRPRQRQYKSAQISEREDSRLVGLDLVWERNHRWRATLMVDVVLAPMEDTWSEARTAMIC